MLPRGSGLWFVDVHADFFDGATSPAGEAADMDLAILTGHGPSGLFERDEPLLELTAVVLLGHRQAEHHELLRDLKRAVDEALTKYQREVFVAAALREVPIDVLAERLGTSRGAVYKTLHDARRRLRDALAEAGHQLDEAGE